MRTVRAPLPRPAGPLRASARQAIAAVGPPTPSRSLRVEPLLRRRARRMRPGV